MSKLASISGLRMPGCNIAVISKAKREKKEATYKQVQEAQ
jgi:hypothetical protein